MRKVLLIALFTLFIGISFAQTMNEMIVIKQAELRQDQIIRQDRKDRMGRVCAGLLILTDLTGLKFEANNGVVDMTYEPGRYMVFVSEGERVLDVYRDGFRPLEIILNQYGIYGLKSGQVYQLEITAKDREVDSLPVVFNITPADARIRVGSLTFTSGEAQPLPVGENEVLIEKEGYRPAREKIEVNSRNIQFNYKLQEIEPVTVKFRTMPEGATVRINNMERGITNRDLLLFPGRYELDLLLNEFVPVKEVIEVKDQGENLFSYNLTRNRGTINFQVSPANAQLLLNGRPVDHTKPQELEPGSYRITISADKHLNETDTIELKQGDTQNKRYNLTRNTGRLKLAINPADAELLINSEKYEHRQEIELVPGTYRIAVNAVSHRGISENVIVSIGEKIEREYKLIPITGTLWLEVFPAGTEVEIISKSGLVRKVIGTARITDLLVGDYTLKASASGHKSEEYRATIIENETARQSITLEEGADVSGNMVLVEGGTFQMGSNAGRDNEKPVHSVTLSSFYIGRYEVTQKQWRDIMGVNPSHFKIKKIIKKGFLGIGEISEEVDNEDYPVEQVSWYDAVDYCNKLSIREGLTSVYSINNNHSPSDWSRGNIVANWSANGYRLPTEAEWEYAARGGNKSKGYTYSGSNTIGEVAWYWYDDNSGSKTHPVGQKRANELGIYDMSGNVWEWCWDWYGSYTSGAKSNPRGASSGSHRVSRGGGWNFSADGCTVSFRPGGPPSNRYSSLGFRLFRIAP